MKKLSPQQQRFVEEYCLGDKTATEAALIAGYSKKRPDVAASKLLAQPHIAAAVEAKRKKLADKFEVTQERIRAELAAVAFGDLRLLYDESGELRSIHELSPEVAAQLAGVEVEELFAGRGEKRKQIGRVRKVKRWDKVRALELLGKDLGMFADRLKFDGPPGSTMQAVVNVSIGK
jgi:phage terminase small subunit